MISLVRVDDRLVHGQVVTQWVSHSKVNRIYIVDDASANDEFMKKMLMSLAPAGTSVRVVTVQSAIENMYRVIEDDKISAMILVKTPEPILKMVQGGVKLEYVTLGGMGAGPGRRKISKNISLTEEEKKMIEDIEALGVEVVCHTVPYESAIPVQEALKKF